MKPVKTQGPATSIVSFDPAPAVSKPPIKPANPAGSSSMSSPPLPVNEAVWPPATAESNSSVAAPEIWSDPVPEIAAWKSSVPEAASSVPVLVTVGATPLVPVPSVFSNRPALSIFEAVELPSAIHTAALAALVADTGRGVPELAGLDVGALHLDGAARVELADGPCPLGGPAVQILSRWLGARATIIAELQGSDPGYLWIPTKPGRPRHGRPPVKPGLTRAAVRTLHAAHRTLVSQLLGTPLRPGALRDHGAVQ